MTVEIYHVADPMFFVGEDDVSSTIESYLALHPVIKVAEIDTDDLDRAYYLSNNIDHSWTENEDVTPEAHVTEKGGCRSSSVGDVFIISNTEGRKLTSHVVAACGFRELRSCNWG